MIHRSKKDLWLVSIVSVSILIPLAVGIYLLLGTGADRASALTLVFISAFTCLIVLLLTYPLRYEVTPAQLRVRCGVMRWLIPLSSIEEVRPTRNPQSAPTWSLDRLQIDYLKNGERRSLLISPEDKSAFIRDVASVAPDLEISGDRLIRATHQRVVSVFQV